MSKHEARFFRFEYLAGEFAQAVKVQVHGAGGRFISTGGSGGSSNPRPTPTAKPEAGSRSRGSGGRFAPREKPPAPAKELTPEEQVAKIASDLAARYPRTRFEFKGMSVESAQRVAAHVDTLFGQYPNVAETIPYLGTGHDSSAYGVRGIGFSSGDMALIKMQGTPWAAQSPMGLNPVYFANSHKADVAMENAELSGWHPAGNLTMEAIITHEFGHVLHNYLSRNGSNASVFSWGTTSSGKGRVSDMTQAFLDKNFKLGTEVSGYAARSSGTTKTGGQREQFAEAFASLHHTKQAWQMDYTKKLSAFLDAVLPGGKPTSWYTLDQNTPKPSNAAMDKAYAAWVKQFL